MRFLVPMQRVSGIFLFLFLLSVVATMQLLCRTVEAQEAETHDPWQITVPQPEAITLEKEGYTWKMSPRARYLITARVLHSRSYDDWQALFVPVDVALGWGKVSDPSVDQGIEWRQEGRWYYYQRVDDDALPKNYIRAHSANVHVVPATETIAAALRQLQVNDMVVMEGFLVDVEAGIAGQTHQFRTSLTRFDEGDSSCEILYVELMVMNGQEYR